MERRRDGETERRRDGETKGFCKSLSATPSLRLSVPPSLRLSFSLSLTSFRRRLWKRPLIGPVEFIVNNRPGRPSGSGRRGWKRTGDSLSRRPRQKGPGRFHRAEQTHGLLSVAVARDGKRDLAGPGGARRPELAQSDPGGAERRRLEPARAGRIRLARFRFGAQSRRTVDAVGAPQGLSVSAARRRADGIGRLRSCAVGFWGDEKAW